MPGANHPADQSREGGALVARQEKTERRLASDKGTPQDPPPFSYSGLLTADTESPPWYPVSPTVLTQVRVSLTTVAVGNVVIELRVDGAAISQHTLTAGQLTTVAAINVVVTPGSYLTVKIITASGANLSVIFRGRRR
jgi:hypothetical protein